MSMEMARNALLWCAVLNFGLVVVWFWLYALAHEWLYRLWGRWFRLTAEQFDTINFAGIALYKVGILLFNLVPYVALRIVG
jgi:hypothetical protein